MAFNPPTAAPMRLRRFLLRYYPPGITLEYEHSGGAQVSQKTIDLLNLSLEYTPRPVHVHVPYSHSFPRLLLCGLGIVGFVWRRKQAGCRARLWSGGCRKLPSMYAHGPFLSSTLLNLWSDSSPCEPPLLGSTADLEALGTAARSATGAGHTCPRAACCVYHLCDPLLGMHEAQRSGMAPVSQYVRFHRMHARQPTPSRGRVSCIDCPRRTNIEALADEIIVSEPLLFAVSVRVAKHGLHMRTDPTQCPASRVCSVDKVVVWCRTTMRFIAELQEKLLCDREQTFYLFKMLRAHILPLTNCAFNKSGDKFITGSYDRTCKVACCCLLCSTPSNKASPAVLDSPQLGMVWDTISGDELQSLEGHRNVVYAIAFNNPYGNRIVTGSFDKTAKLWDAESGECLHTLRGHITEIVCLCFNPQSDRIATGSMDNNAKLWDVETGQELFTMLGHSAEIVSLNFNTIGDLVVTGSFDHSARLWDVRTGKCVHVLSGHRGEISSTQFNHGGDLAISGSIDRTCRVWNVLSGQCIFTLRGHTDEVLDVAFNASGSKLVTASADSTSRVYSTVNGHCISSCVGHEGEISKVAFNPQGTKVITASSDKTCKIWAADTGELLQTLEGHTDEIFSCAFNYE
eukprot:gene12152-2217_t